MTQSALGGITIGGIFAVLLLLPHAVVAARRRVSKPILPVPTYAAHLLLLACIRVMPMIKDAFPRPSVLLIATAQVLAIWAAAVTVSEWARYRHAARRAPNV